MINIYQKLSLGLFFIVCSIATQASEILISDSTKKDSGLFVEAPVTRYCMNPPNVEQNDTRADHSRGKLVDPELEAASHSSFLKARVLRVELNHDGRCDSECQTAIAFTLLQSLALWRGGCIECESNSGKVVVIDGKIWVDNVSLEKWRYSLDNDISGAVYDPLGLRRIHPGRAPLVSYISFDSHSVRERICTANHSIDIDKEVLSTLCESESTSCISDSCMDISLGVGKKISSCKLPRGAVACGLPDQSVGLNTEDFKFKYKYGDIKEKTGEFGLGRNSVSLLYTMIHEVGHWFGLPHDDYTTKNWPVNIMSPSYSAGRPWCISGWNLVQLNNAVDVTWRYRLKGNTALIYSEE